MLRSNRGAARVSAVWMISVGVVALASLAFGFISQNDQKTERDRASAAQVLLSEADSARADADEKKRNVSVVLGWYDRASADPETDVEAAQQYLEDLRATFSDLQGTDGDFETAIPKIIDAYNQRGTEISTLKTRITTLEGEVTSANNAVAQITQTKDSTIGDLRTQLSDEQNNAQQRQQELEDRVSGVQQQLADRDAELRTVRAESVDAGRTWEEERKVTEARMLNLTQKTKFAREDFANNPDGKVLEVSQATGIAWIDLGADNRLTRGTRFRIEGGLPGKMELKGWGEVTKVDARRAQMSITSVEDNFNYIRPGDVVINPVYDPTGSRTAVLAGSFSEFSKTELATLLTNLAIDVQSEVGPTTDFLIVGGMVYSDPETDEPLEEPLPVEEMAAYKDAVNLQIQIVPLRDLRQFFRFDVASR